MNKLFNPIGLFVLLVAIMFAGGYNIYFIFIVLLFVYVYIKLEKICVKKYKIKKQHTLKTFYNDNKCDIFAQIVVLILLILFLTLTDFKLKG